METIKVFGGLFVIIYLWIKIAEYFDNKKAEKEIPAILNEIDSLNAKMNEYLEYESYIDESVKKFRDDYEHKKSVRAKLAKEKSRTQYQSKSRWRH